MTTVKLSQIKPSSRPVRTSWDEEKMEELAQSVRENGVIQPVKLRPDNGGYEIVFGHRRVEAARRAGLTEVPAVVEGMNDSESLVQALIENIQREDLAPMDRARGLRSLMDIKNWSMVDVERHGIMAHARAGQILMLLKEPIEIQQIVGHFGSGVSPESGEIGVDNIRVVREAGLKGDEGTQIIMKAAAETLTIGETRRVAEAYRDAKTDEERQAVLRVSGKNPAFERAVNVQTAIDRAEDYQERKVQRRHQENDSEVAQFFDAVRAFMLVVETMISAVDFGKFSQEGARFAMRRIDSLISKLQELKEQLNNDNA